MLNALLLGLALGIGARLGGPLGLLLMAAAVAAVGYRWTKGRNRDISPRNEVEKWIFGTYANWAQYNAQLGEKNPDGSFPIERPDTTSSPFYIGGRPQGKGERKYYLDMLDSPWDIHSKRELLETVEYMSTGPGFQRCLTKADQAWELCRCTQLLAIAFRLGWISRQDMVRRSCRVGKLIQKTFSGWQEMSESFLARCLQWMEDPSLGADMRRAIHRALWLRPDSPYNLPWDLPLD